MEEDAMEQIRAHLAAATSAAGALAESLEQVGENTLRTLQKWLAKQTGPLKCGHCRAQLPRGKEASVCIACGSARSPQPSEFDFRVSFAFLQFLETIHPPIKLLVTAMRDEGGGPGLFQQTMKFYDHILKCCVDSTWTDTASILNWQVGGSRMRTSLLLPRPRMQATRSSGEDLADHLKSPLEKALSREGSAAGKDQSLSECREVSSDDRSGFSNADEVTEIATIEDLHETSDFLATDSNLGVTALNSVQQVVQMQNQDLSYLETSAGNHDVKESTAKRTSETVSNCSILSPVGIAEGEGQKQDTATVNLGRGCEEASTAFSHVPDYDLSFFETLGEKAKEESTAKGVDTAGDYWHSYAKNRNTKLGNMNAGFGNALERFTSDASAFTTLTDGDSDSENSTFEAFPPPKPPLDILMEVGTSGREDDLVGPLESFDGGDIQEVLTTSASHPLSTVDPFSWPLEVLEASTSIPAKDFLSTPDLLALNPTSSVAPSVDPFLWTFEESNQPSSTQSLGTPQEVLNPSVSGPSSVRIVGQDPFSWPLETFNQPILPSNLPSGVVIEPSLLAPVDDFREEDTADWSEDEFVWSQAEPSIRSLVEDPFLASTEKSPAQPEFQPPTFNLEVSLEKDGFFLDQSTPGGTGENRLPSSPGCVMNLGLEVEGLAISKGEAPTKDSEYSRSIHIRSISFGKSETATAPLDQIEDLLKRSVSSGNLHSNINTQSDDLFNQLKIPSASNLPLPTRQLGDEAEDLLEFLNLKPASSTDSKAASDMQKENSMKPLHVRSVSFGTLELLPEEQSEDMFQFFHSRSYSAGSSELKSVPAENGNSSNRDTFDRLPSQVRATDGENPSGSEDLVNCIKETVPSQAKTQTIEVKEEVTEDDDDFFEWQSAETLCASTSQTVTQSAVPAQARTNQEVLFHLAPSPPQPFPVTSPKKPSSNGLPSGLSSLAGTFPEKSPMPQGIPSPDDKDLFQSLSRKSLSAKGLQTSQIVNMDVFAWPQATGQLAYGSEDEFSDFVSNDAAPAPQPLLSQLGKALASKPALEMSFLEQLQPSTHERHNSDFFGDLMSLNFTNM